MNKQELITAVSTKTGLTKGETEKTVNALLKIVSDELVASGQISLNGLGTFVVVHRGAHPGRNPRGTDLHPGIEDRPLESFQKTQGCRQRLKGAGRHHLSPVAHTVERRAVTPSGTTENAYFRQRYLMDNNSLNIIHRVPHG